eukprot:TRINITY_DN1453_c1_g1_i1.p1 TRINITY_DN1453_c1_g1~~TRINITY_DN1453_c1_g1_i1.p1  ORF type:complete len:690 (+),score=240.58 TRINITY_DN1453_c1_g1_i1:44-2113(+)
MDILIILLLVVLLLIGAVAYLFWKNSKEEECAPAPIVIKKDVIHPFTILFGTQTGTSESFANELAREAKAHNFVATVRDMQDYDSESLAKEHFVVFIMSTYGEGEPTDNAKQFYDWINSNAHEKDELKHVNYAVFALGNRTYEQYCAVGRQVDKRMNELGANRVVDIGEGDDADGDTAEFWNAWKNDKFWPSIHSFFGTANKEDIKPFVSSLRVTWMEKESKQSASSTSDAKDGEHMVKGDRNVSLFRALVVENRELRQDISDGLSTCHIELEVKENTYKTAENLGVHPRNDYKLAAQLAKRLGVRLEASFTLDSLANKPMPFPSPLTVQNALLWYCDFQIPVRSSLVQILAQYARDATDKQKLLYLASVQGKEELSTQKYSLFDLLFLCPSVLPPFDHFLDFCPRLLPRYYTISSSSLATPNRIAMTVSLAVTPKPKSLLQNRTHLGICSSYLCRAKPGKEWVTCFVKASSFVLPKPNAPIIMIGPGTGIAPFRAFLHEAAYLHHQPISSSSLVLSPTSSSSSSSLSVSSSSALSSAALSSSSSSFSSSSSSSSSSLKGFAKSSFRFGPMYLFFGCRSKTKDFLYQEELTKAEQSGLLTKLFTAFSRDQEKKVYVQDLISENGRMIWDLIDKDNAYIYVCGATSMGKSVREAIQALSAKYGKYTDKEWADYFKDILQKHGRYVAELWD